MYIIMMVYINCQTHNYGGLSVVKGLLLIRQMISIICSQWHMDKVNYHNNHPSPRGNNTIWGRAVVQKQAERLLSVFE